MVIKKAFSSVARTLFVLAAFIIFFVPIVGAQEGDGRSSGSFPDTTDCDPEVSLTGCGGAGVIGEPAGISGSACVQEDSDQTVCPDPFIERFMSNPVPKKDVVEDEPVCGDLEEGEDVPAECDCKSDGGEVNADNCEIVATLEIGTNVLAGAAAVAVVGGIMYGGFLYMTARDNPGQVQAAKARIAWALAALLILIFFWGFLQWLIPGGVL